ncbi:DGQHR domain-containing protein [Neobacillus terrae]|uniref:DGQHR domain-containing protein n=1 Tax=Neobacillus terrae TaxID=3034837 RepID=UPI00140C5B8D|nr:DGQHR domain-containing protein [Neobacillus terrae]NHM32075.1 DGQHR domain-containing protein [Neobacillus terrae]
MGDYLPSNIVIENVLQFKMRGRVAYQGFVSSQVAIHFSHSKPYNHPSGKGYQRPINKQRSKEFANYLSKGEDSLFTPILLNAAGNWEFHSYNKERPLFGRLVAKKKASLMDGQHRLAGIEEYVKKTDATLNIPFLVFHYLDEDEEIKLFDIINTKAKGIGTSLSRYLNRDNDDISWIATNLILRPESPFYSKGTLIGKRNKDKHITLQNLYNLVSLLIKKSDLADLSKEKILSITLFYFNAVREILSSEWEDVKSYRLTHILSLNALAIVGNEIINKNFLHKSQQPDSSAILAKLQKLNQIDWSSNGDLKYLKGASGSKILAQDILNCIK